MKLEFGDDMSLITEPSPILEIPLPVTFQQPAFGILSQEVYCQWLAQPANWVHSCYDPENYTSAFQNFQ